MNSTERLVLNRMKKGKEYTAKEVANLCGLSVVYTRRVLSDLQKKGFVKRRWFGMWLYSIVGR